METKPQSLRDILHDDGNTTIYLVLLNVLFVHYQ
jgi:hypothetical protein